MALIKHENNKGSGKYSWHVRWKECVGGKMVPQCIVIGRTTSINKKTAQSNHDMILSLVGTVETDKTFDRQQQLWLADIPNKLHRDLEKYGLTRERAAQRSNSAFRLEAVCDEFVTMKEAVVTAATKTKFEQSTGRLLTHFGVNKDIRDITAIEAKNYPRSLKDQGYIKRPKVKLRDSYVAKQVDQVKELFRWAVSEGLIETDVFAYGVKTNKNPDQTRIHYITLSETQDLFNCQYDLKSLARIVLARLMGLRGAADTLWIRKCDVNFAGGDVGRAEVIVDSHKTGGRKCPMFHDGVWIIFKLLCDAEPSSKGYLFKGDKEDDVRAGKKRCDFSLGEQYMGRYEVATGGARISKPFSNARSSWVTDVVKVFKLDKHDCSVWIGHTEAIQDSNYLQVINEDYKAALQQWSESSVDGLENTSLFFSMVYESLEKNLPELAPAAFNHAQQITRKAMQGMFANTTPNTTPNTPIRHPSDAVSDDLLQSILETTSVEELARNTLVLQGLQRLMQSSKEASSLVKTLSSAGAKVAEEGLEPPTPGL
jgi:hypothetical protein